MTLFRFKACIKCGGDLALDEGDWLCLQCGKYYYLGLYRERDRTAVRWPFPKTRGFVAKGYGGGIRYGGGEERPVVFKARTGLL